MNNKLGSFKKTAEIIAGVEGWLTVKEGKILYFLARQIASETAIVEIGSWKGRSTICLAKGAQEGQGAKVYAVDTHTGSHEHHKMLGQVNTLLEFQHNIKRSGVDNVVLIQTTSNDAATDFSLPVGLIFIDGAHEYCSVNLDFEKWFPKIINGGKIVFHDSWHILGPNLVSAKVLLFSRQIRRPKLVHTATVLEKVAKNSLLDRVFNRYFLIWRTMFGLFGLLKIKLDKIRELYL